VTRAPWVLFAYHTIGARALEALVARGEEVAVIVPSRGVAVATGAGVLVITRVQGAGGLAEPADRWAARRGLRPGARL
jgi:methionyl-tRNA formyltransferase